MNMFPSVLSSIPKSRSELVNDLDLPEITLPPYTETWRDIDSLSTDSLLSGYEQERLERGTLSTDSSIALSRAMTDSEISYGRYKRYKNMGYDNPWDQLRDALDVFPSKYLNSLNSFRNYTYWTDPCVTEDLGDYAAERRRHREDLKRRMNLFFDTECCPYLPDDPGLLALEDALDSLDMKALEADIATIRT